MVDIRRLLPRRRRHRTAEGVVVFGSPGIANDQQALTTLLGRHERLAGWMTTAGLDLEVSSAGLRVVNSLIEEWLEDPTVAPGLINEVGVFLGDVLLHEIADARWWIWPNGHPVIRLRSGPEIDVIAQTAVRVQKGRPPLNDTLETATRR